MTKKTSDGNKRKWLIVISVILILALLIWHFISPRGAFEYYNLRKQLKEIKTQNEILEQENQGLRDEISRLENDPSYVEKIAREKYGMIRKNEVLYRFDNGGKKADIPTDPNNTTDKKGPPGS